MDDVAKAIIDYVNKRTRLDPIPLNHPKTAEELRELCGSTITSGGLGGLWVVQRNGCLLYTSPSPRDS